MKGLILAVCCALALLVPVAAADAAPASSSSKSRVTVGAKIKRFAVVDRKIVARGVLTSRVTGGGETKAAKTPVTFAVAAQAGRCHVLTLNLKDLQLSLLGLNVDLSEVNLRIFAVRRGADSGILGRLFCALSRSSVRLGRGASTARAHEVVRALNSRLEDHPMRAFRATAVVAREGDASAAQAAPSCKVLHLELGPLDLNLLGLVVQLYGANPRQPVTLDITATPGGGVLGDLFCSVSGGPTP
ncbi:MAG TPA: hypothetical protein VM824_04875 [Thermoleophilaceae bacterium]|jgi:hypothetical protein|nr:hypothetical protein [Thermoleophilaceae bacterium]